MELIQGNFQAYQCTIADYARIVEIYKSQTYIQGSPRTAVSDEKFEHHLADILLGSKKNCYVLGAKDLTTNRLTSYALYTFPKNSQFGFLQLGGTISNSGSVTNFSGISVTMLRLGVMLGASLGYFDIFWSIKLSSYLPVCKVFNTYEANSNEENKSYWLLHKVIYPNDPIETSIDKFLLNDSIFDRLYPVAIMHTALKEKYRVQHFKKHFSVSEETLKKCTVPYYSLTTSTTTDSPTNS
jgi:hypothetical protein